LQRTGTVAVGERPFAISIDEDGKRAYTANVKSNDVSVIDLAEHKIVATVAVGRGPYGIALAQGRAFVTNQYSSTVSVIDLTDFKVIQSLKVGDYPEGIVADAQGNNLYVACWEANTLERINAKDLEVTGKVEVGDGPRGFGLFLR